MKSLSLLFNIALFLSVFHVALSDQELPFETCIAEDRLGVEKVVVSEYPLAPGSDVTFAIYLTPKEDITAGKIDLQVTIHKMKIFSTTVDLCEDTALQCPLAAGEPVKITSTNEIPPTVPSNLDLNLQINAVDQTGATISCITVEIEFSVSGYSRSERQKMLAIDSSLLADIQMRGPRWRSHWSPKFANATLAQVSHLMGTFRKGHPFFVEDSLPPLVQEGETYDDYYGNETIPESFDARDRWPACAEVVGHIRDQSSCGSCWAHSSTEALNDRLCINYGEKELLSTADTLACCTGSECLFSQGCNGGQPAGAFRFFAEKGVVTGGDYRDIGLSSTCLPYPFEACAHHVEPTADLPACPAEDYDTPRCRTSCTERGYEKVYLNDKHFAKRGYSIPNDVQSIQRDIMTYGSVSAAFSVYQDFLTYESGVYQQTTGMPLGGHAVKIIGWGSQEGADFWLVANSWGPSWGEGGYFKILRGTNECGIEEEIVSGLV